ncbi:hypothetical protein [Candidatus Endowatersipora endosymbiont of Watersipora subatra]|uniref:hypothetical protein n=1 Tax=Candidatus Endowatersipora endosymbiont of Watersipora subatra TaxID=3077946 RepID=UPI00312C78F4
MIDGRNLPISIIAGLLSAFLFLAPLTFGKMGFLFSSFTTLPLFVSVLGFGIISGLVSSSVLILVIAMIFDVHDSAEVFIITLLPTLWIGYLVTLRRYDSGCEQWFPLESVFFRIVLFSGVVALTFGAVTQYSTEANILAINDLIKEWMQTTPGLDPNNAEMIRIQALAMANIMPIAMPISIMLLLILNLHIGVRIAGARGWLLRPKDDIPSSTSLPLYVGVIFTAALILSFLSGKIGLVAKVVSGTSGGAFAMVGLATLHKLTKGFQWRNFVLSLTYFSILIFILITGPLLAALGMAETLFQLRKRHTLPPPSSI